MNALEWRTLIAACMLLNDSRVYSMAVSDYHALNFTVHACSSVKLNFKTCQGSGRMVLFSADQWSRGKAPGYMSLYKLKASLFTLSTALTTDQQSTEWQSVM